jgi:hypothetical protein
MITHVLNTSGSVALDDLTELVPLVLASLTKDAKAFSYASNLYNSDFFINESVETKTALCTALASFFGPEFQNGYWNKNRSITS